MILTNEKIESLYEQYFEVPAIIRRNGKLTFEKFILERGE